MFFAIKAKSFKVLRTLPTIWICYVRGVPHCWIPKIGYSHKLKNRAQPPNESDVEARQEWHFIECEILFNGKVFVRLTDGELALSKLNYGSEWYFNPESIHFLQPVNEFHPSVDTDIMPNALLILSQLIQYDDDTTLPVSQLMQKDDAQPFSIDMPIIEPINMLNEPINMLNEPIDITSGSTTLPDTTLPVSQLMQNDDVPLSSIDMLNESIDIPSGSTNEFHPSVDTDIMPNALLILSQLIQYDDDTTLPVSQLMQKDDTQPFSIDMPIIEPINMLNEPINMLNEPIDITSGSTTLPDTTLSVSQLMQNDDVQLSSIDMPIIEPTCVVHYTDTVMTDLNKYKENKRLCRLYHFMHPINYRNFEKLTFNYVKTFDTNNLRPGYVFQSIAELTSIKRKFSEIPFCRPGPLSRGEYYDWYLVDSIVQEVFLKTHTYPFYVVRWLGYEDEFNTVEPLACVKHTAVHKLFMNPNLSPSCRAKNGCILRRSSRNVVQYEVAKTVELKMDIGQSIYERSISWLVHELRLEEEAGQYCPLIGFCSFKGTMCAWKAQHKFFQEKFLPMVNQLDSTIHLDNHYVGQVFGNLQKVAEFKEFASMGIKNTKTLKCFIDRGLSINSTTSEPRYVSFFVPRKFNTNEKKETIQMDLHMCVFTVRSYGGKKEAIYYDPSPKCFSHGLPDVLDELRKPVLKSFTKAYGVSSEKDDCFFQCMCYIIGIATKEVPFEPDLSEPCRKIDRFVAERASKKMKMDE